MSGPSNDFRRNKDAKPFEDEDALAAFYKACGQELAKGFGRYERGDYEFDLQALVEEVHAELQRLTPAMQAIDKVARMAGKHAPIVRDDEKLTINQVRAFWKIRCLRGKMPAEVTVDRANNANRKLPGHGAQWQQAEADLRDVSKLIGEAKEAPEQAALQSRFMKATKDYNRAHRKLLELLTPRRYETAGGAEPKGSATTGGLFRPEQDYVTIWEDVTKGMSGRVTPRQELVRELRNELKWSQQRLSDETRRYRPDRDIGVGVRTIRRVEDGRKVNVRTLGYIAKALGVDLASLVRNEDAEQ